MTTANIVINVAVDVPYIYSQKPGAYVGKGIYMMDTNFVNGSTGEGSMELTTHGAAGQSVAFNVFPINVLQNVDAYAGIEGMEQSSGTNVFGNQGWPAAQTPDTPYQYLGFLMKSGDMTYQIKIGVTPNQALFPVQYYTWDPFFNIGTNAAFAELAKKLESA
ncbi:MAG: hypothetical protein P8Y48_06865 [Novosphingobium sp.]